MNAVNLDSVQNSPSIWNNKKRDLEVFLHQFCIMTVLSFFFHFRTLKILQIFKVSLGRKCNLISNNVHSIISVNLTFYIMIGSTVHSFIFELHYSENWPSGLRGDRSSRHPSTHDNDFINATVKILVRCM